MADESQKHQIRGWGCPELAKRRKAARRAGRGANQADRFQGGEVMPEVTDIENASNWLNVHCHCAHLRTILRRSLEYAEAVERAGLYNTTVSGQDLYEFLTDDRVRAAFVKAFPQPTL
jgi:hypothetical protein